MSVGLLFGAIMPHPPIIIPEIGGKRINEAANTKRALEVASKRLKTKNVDTIVVITPHGEVGQAAVPIYTSHIFEGHFGAFGCPEPRLSFRGDSNFGFSILKECDKKGISAAVISESFLDHGALVPLYYINSVGIKKPILPIAIAFIPLKDLFDFGRVISGVAKNLNKKIAIIASADMSHRLKEDSPSGYHPKGKEFDEKLVELVKNYDVENILNFDEELAEVAGQDSLWSIAILLGALDGLKVKHEVLSYEGPFGVGYMVATFEVI